MAANVKVSGKKHIHYTLDMEDCPRCGSPHEVMIFTPLTNAEGPEDLWAFCETAGEPLLLSSGDID